MRQRKPPWKKRKKQKTKNKSGYHSKLPRNRRPNNFPHVTGSTCMKKEKK